MIQKSFQNKKSTLFLVATAIGNLEDLTLRAKKTLESVDVIFVEDTRVTKKLLSYLKINKPLISFHQHNEFSTNQKVIKCLDENKQVALISDAGYPLISDPGEKLVSLVINAGYNVVSIPGASAFLNALVASGLSTTNFTFCGFLERKESAIKKQLENFKYRPETLIFYLSIHRLRKGLTIMQDIFQDRLVCLARELTKIYETFYRGRLSELLKLDLESFQGECVVVVDGYKNLDWDFGNLPIKEHVLLISKKQNVSLKVAIKEVADMRNMARSVVYKIFHQD